MLWQGYSHNVLKSFSKNKYFRSIFTWINLLKKKNPVWNIIQFTDVLKHVHILWTCSFPSFQFLHLRFLNSENSADLWFSNHALLYLYFEFSSTANSILTFTSWIILWKCEFVDWLKHFTSTMNALSIYPSSWKVVS